MADRPLPFWPRGLREDLAAEYVGLSVTTWRREVAEQRAPAPVRLTPGRIVWLRDDLDNWLDRLAGRAPASTPAASGSDWDTALGGNGGSALSAHLP